MKIPKYMNAELNSIYRIVVDLVTLLVGVSDNGPEGGSFFLGALGSSEDASTEGVFATANSLKDPTRP